MVIVFFANQKYSDRNEHVTTIIIFSVIFLISYVWGIIFGALLFCIIDSNPTSPTISIATTLNTNHENVYLPIPQQPQDF